MVVLDVSVVWNCRWHYTGGTERVMHVIIYKQVQSSDALRVCYLVQVITRSKKLRTMDSSESSTFMRHAARLAAHLHQLQTINCKLSTKPFKERSLQLRPSPTGCNQSVGRVKTSHILVPPSQAGTGPNRECGRRRDRFRCPKLGVHESCQARSGSTYADKVSVNLVAPTNDQRRGG